MLECERALQHGHTPPLGTQYLPAQLVASQAQPAIQQLISRERVCRRVKLHVGHEAPLLYILFQIYFTGLLPVNCGTIQRDVLIYQI